MLRHGRHDSNWSNKCNGVSLFRILTELRGTRLHAAKAVNALIHDDRCPQLSLGGFTGGRHWPGQLAIEPTPLSVRDGEEMLLRLRVSSLA